MSTGTTTPELTSTSFGQRVGVTVGQRFFPPSPKTAPLPEGAAPLSEFAQGIVDRLRGEMVFFKTQGRHLTYGDLLDDVLTSVHVIERAVEEFREFVRKIAATNLVVEQEEFEHDELRAQTYRRACEEFVEESRVWESLPYPTISAKREASRNMEQHDTEHVRELETLLQEFALLVQRTLDQLVTRQLAGVVQWGTDTSCDFHFFNTLVVQQVHQRYEFRRELHSQVVHDDHLYT